MAVNQHHASGSVLTGTTAVTAHPAPITPETTMQALRIIGALAAIVTALVHGWEWAFNGYGDPDLVSPVIGTAFLVNTVAGIVIAILLFTWRGWIPWFLLFGLGASTLGAFIISSTVGLFGVREQWRSGPVWIAAIAEAVAIVVPIVVWLRSSRRAAV